jgi:serine/threonine protein kinase/beta-lactam-binding protein with PASTA domain
LSENKRMIADRYEVGALIGRGGMADVYEGIDTRLGRKIAIKVLKADLVADPSFEVKFRQEAQNSARMTHPTIVRVYDTGEEESVDGNGNPRRTPYIIMEYVPGTVLRDLLHARKLSTPEAIGFAEGILTALEFSHRAGIIHRDIKAANVMITETGAVKVMDFGIARAMSDSSATQSHTTGIVGTAQYFSPEQARGETVDARTDLYSTGVLLYEMLAGRPPFVGESAVSVAYQHVSEVVTPPSAHNPDISKALDEVVLHALAKDRNERYQSAEQFREHLLSAALAPIESEPTAPIAFDDFLDGTPAEALETVVMPAAEPDSFDELLGSFTEEVPVEKPVTNPFSTLGMDFEPEIVDTSVKTELNPKNQKLVGLAWGFGAGLVVVVIGLLIYLVGFAKINVNLPTNTNVTVTDVSGKTVPEATATLEALGFTVSEVQAPSDTVVIDTIISTNPPAGEHAEKGSNIELTVSSGPSQVAVPSLLGLTETQAKDALTAAGLQLGTITPGTSPTVPLGKVIQSTPEVGTYAAGGSTVDLIISNGKVDVPDVSSMNINQAKNQLSGASGGLKVLIGTQEVGCANNPPLGSTVLGQSIPQGTTKQGSTITLYVSCNAN